MPNLRLIHDNAADRATLTATSSVGSLVAANLKSDSKAAVWRAAGSSARITAVWATKERIGGIALPFCNLSKDATMRVRVSNEVSATNLFRYPRHFGNSAWFKWYSEVQSNVAIAPDGTMTADKLVEDATFNSHTREQIVTFSAGTRYVTSWFVRPDERVRVIIRFKAGAFTTERGATFNASTKTVSGIDAGVNAGVIDVGGGWCRCWISSVADASASSGIFIAVVDMGAISYQGDGRSGISIWHAQAEVGGFPSSVIPEETSFVSRSSPKHYFDQQGKLQLAPANTAATDYDPVSRVSKGLSLEGAAPNQLPYPRNFDNAAWFKVNVRPVPKVGLGPDGNMSMDKLVESAAAGADHYIYQSRNGSNETVTLMVVVKSDGRSRISLMFSNFGGASAQVNFDLAAGTVVSTDSASADYSAISGYIEPWGNGVWLCAITVTKAAINTTNSPVIWLKNVLGQSNYTGDGVSGIQIFHAQVVTGAVRGSIVPDGTSFVSRNSPKWEFNAAGVLTQYAANVAVIAYDAGTRLSRGLSLEADGVNFARQSSQVGIGGVYGNPDGSVTTLNAALSPDGTMNASSHSFPTLNGGASSRVDQNIVALVGLLNQTVTFSIWLKGSGTLAMTMAAVGGTGFVQKQVTLSNSWTRFELTGTFANTGTSFFAYFGRQDGAATATAVQSFGFQVEVADRASSYMPSTAAPASRAADVSTSAPFTRAADVSVSAQAVRSAGFIDNWQSYQYDSGQILACAGDPVVPDGWIPAMAAANSYAYGGGNRAWHWLPKMDALGISIDINDPSNPAGFIEAARMVIGDYWTPKYNFDYGRELGLNDTSTHERSAAGNLETEVGQCFDSLSFSLKNITNEDLTSFLPILRRVGMRRSVFVSLYPESLNRALEREHQLLCKFANAKAVLTSVSYGYNDTLVALEQV